LHEDKIIAAAVTAGVHEMVQRLPEGYDTQIGEGGHTLSGGQRQRIGLTRALYGNPAFIVLDEPNANLDAEGEAALIAALGQLRQNGQTVVLITHKTSLLAVVDRMLVLKAGEVHAFGTFDEVVAATEPAPKVISEPAVAKMPKATPIGPVALVG
jgi:ABC-type protease/lipase transport system fused ATPase/permease subunit